MYEIFLYLLNKVFQIYKFIFNINDIIFTLKTLKKMDLIKSFINFINIFN